MGFALSDMQLESESFTDGAPVPTRHTGEGEDVSPAFTWHNVPDGTQEFALICHDPDAPLIKPDGYGYVHWLLYNVPGAVSSLPEGVSDYTTGITDFGRDGYGGPMPPEGHGTHRYFFWLFALNDRLNLDSGLTMSELLKQIEPSVIGMNRLMGTYSRPAPE